MTANGNSGTKIIKRYANRKLYDTVQSCYVTLEFGTYPIAELLRCLREDHRVRKPGQQPFAHPDSERVRQQLLKQFYPAEPQWQTLVLMRGRQVIQMACQGLMNG